VTAREPWSFLQHSISLYLCRYVEPREFWVHKYMVHMYLYTPLLVESIWRVIFWRICFCQIHTMTFHTKFRQQNWRDSNPGSSVPEAGALTIMPRLQGRLDHHWWLIYVIFCISCHLFACTHVHIHVPVHMCPHFLAPQTWNKLFEFHCDQLEPSFRFARPSPLFNIGRYYVFVEVPNVEWQNVEMYTSRYLHRM
jgi:hypothetical protein